MRYLFGLMISLLIGTISFAQATPFQRKFADIDRYIDTLMKDWNIPGFAIGIVYKDELIYAKGFGFRDLEKKLPVETTTIFPIASNTKLFTSTAACILSSEGRMSLDVPVKKYMPGLNFSNDELNAKVTMRDLLSHRTGLPRYDGLWVASPFSRDETIARVMYMQPQLGFREGYIYNNMMFATAGAVMEKITDMSWEDIIRKKILQPLAMNATCFTNEEMRAGGNFAASYFEPDSTKKLVRNAYEGQSAALGPAGTIKSNIQDMSHWMIAQLNAGVYNNKLAIPAAAIRQTLIPNNIADKEGLWPELSNSLYALGRTIQTYKGYKIAMHTGSIDGFYSNLSFVPSENIAVFMVHNGMAGGSIRSIMALPVIDRLLSLTLTPWSTRYRQDYLQERKNDKRYKDSIKATQVKNTKPSHILKDYAGLYVSPVYGEFIIELQNDQLFMNFRGQRALLNHFHYDQFVTDEEAVGKPDFRIGFVTGTNGVIERFKVRLFGDPECEFAKNRQ